MSKRSNNPPDLQRILEQALRSYHVGQHDQTARLCRRILKTVPGEPNALHLLGVVQLLNGEVEQAEDALRQAAALAPDSPHAHLNLANLLRAHTRPRLAAESYRRVLELEPDHRGARNGLGLVLDEMGEHDAALEIFRAAIETDPEDAEAHRNAAELRRRHGTWRDSLADYDAALAIAPDDAAGYAGRGFVLRRLGRLDDAVTAFEAALERDPNSIDARVNYGSALCEAGRADEALEHLRRAVAADPADPDAHSNLGNVLADLGRFEDSLVHYDRALTLAPEHADAWANQAATLKRMGRHGLALEAFDAALEHEPGHPGAAFGRAVTRLMVGDFAGGWRDYLGRPSMCPPPPGLHREPLPHDLAGRRILVVKDQGLGDELFFLRFVPALARRGATLIYEADPRLRDPIERSRLFGRVIVAGEARPEADWAVSIGDLPFLLGADGAAGPLPPVEIPVLGDRTHEIAGRLDVLGPPPRIGGTWRAGTRADRHALCKEAPLVALATELGKVGGTVIALQRDPHPGELGAFAAALRRPLGDLTGLNDDLEAMLALVDLLDDYVCISNTNVHLRAVRGRASRVLIPNASEFRWMAAGSRSPWFPESPLYRQAPDGRWQGAMKWLATDLAAAHGPVERHAG